MKRIELCDGSALVIHDPSDMPPCRKCGARPVVKGGHQSQRLECPECGMRTRQSTSGPDYGTWMAVMGGDAEC